MRLRKMLLACLAAFAMTGAANAAIVFSDNFNSETPGLDASLTQWTVGPGTIDVVPCCGGLYDFYPGNGQFVDMDGSTFSQGTITTLASFGPGSYTLTFNLGGSQRGDADNGVLVSLGGFSATITLASADPLGFYSFTFGTAGGALSFASLSGNDNIGLILDNVVLSAVPEPSTWAMMLIGFAGLGLVGARRRKAVAAA